MRWRNIKATGATGEPGVQLPVIACAQAAHPTRTAASFLPPVPLHDTRQDFLSCYKAAASLRPQPLPLMGEHLLHTGHGGIVGHERGAVVGPVGLGDDNLFRTRQVRGAIAAAVWPIAKTSLPHGLGSLSQWHPRHHSSHALLHCFSPPAVHTTYKQVQDAGGHATTR